MDDKNYDLRIILIDADVRKWHTEQIAHQWGWLYDVDDNDEWPLRQYRFFRKCLLAHDFDFRNEYLEFMKNPAKRREYGAESVAEEEWDRVFFGKWFTRCREQGGAYFEKKMAAVYFANDPKTMEWYREIYLNDNAEWRYEASRDDLCLAKILSTTELRVKTPQLVQRVLFDFCATYIQTLSFEQAYGYDYEQFCRDIYARLFESKNAKNRINYWVEKRPCFALKDWVEVETWREIERTKKRLQRRLRRERMTEFLWEKMDLIGAKAKSNENEMPDLEALFARFFAVDSEGAALIAAYYNSELTFDKLASLWRLLGSDNAIGGKTLNKRHERALEQWKSVVEEMLEVKIDESIWKKIFRNLKSEARMAQELEQEVKAPNFGKSPSDNWRKNIRFVPEGPTEETIELWKTALARVLTNQRHEEIGGGWELTFSNETQGGGLQSTQTDVALVRRRRGEPATRRKGALDRPELISDTPWQISDEARMRASGIPVPILGCKRIYNFWRKKHGGNDNVVFYFESTESIDSQTFWQASVRIPCDADRESEIAIVVDWRDRVTNTPFKAAPVEFKWGDYSVPIICGVAKIKVGDFRVDVKGRAPSVTMKIRFHENSWHVAHNSPGRLLFGNHGPFPGVATDDE